jgi:acetyl-CoA/propionyl-CoA carboxylase biotin carboxyl carrier protein
MFMPAPGTVHKYSEPGGPWVRVDSACYTGYQVLPFYDSLLAKLVVWGRDRNEAIARTRIALKNFQIEGLSTTIPFHLILLDDPAFQSGEVYTTYVEKELQPKLKGMAKPAAPAAKVESNGNGSSTEEKTERTATRTFEVEVNQKHFKVAVAELKAAGEIAVQQVQQVQPVKATAAVPQAAKGAARPAARKSTGEHSVLGAGKFHAGEVRSSMHGLVKQLLVNEGDAVTQGQKLLILEAMKMESEVLCDRAGKVSSLKVKTGETVQSDQVLLLLTE